jgi:hypothetical protein
MTLAELQTKFQAGILEGDETILASIADSPKTGRATLFAVYYNAYRSRLAEFLSNDFPFLRDYLGEEDFGRLVEDYTGSTLSRHPNARWYGSQLPDFMTGTTAWRMHKRAIDLARFERALTDAFDAAEAPFVSIDTLRDICVEDWPRLVLEFHPCIRLLDLAKGTMKTYDALAEGEEPPEAQQGEEAVLIWRSDGQTYYRAAANDERLAFMEACNGQAFGDICALLAFQSNGHDMTQQAASFLAQWFADGFVTRVSLS